MLNDVKIMGRLANFEPIFKAGEDNKAFLAWSVNVKRNFKPEGEKYYPTDLFKIKAFNGVANFIHNNFQKGDPIIISGRLAVEEDYTKEDGTEVKGGVVIHVEQAMFTEAKANNDNRQDSDKAPKTAQKTSNPLSKGAKKNWL